MKIIITGATGFLGGWTVASLLNKSFDLTIIRNQKSNIKYRENSQYLLNNLNQECKEVFIDLLDYESVEMLIKNIKPDAIIHMAAVVDIPNPPALLLATKGFVDITSILIVVVGTSTVIFTTNCPSKLPVPRNKISNIFFMTIYLYIKCCI